MDWKYDCGLLLGGVMVAFLAVGCAALPEKPVRPLSVVFIGNSYTGVNVLPKLFQEIAESAGYPRPVVASSVPGGCTLERHLKTPGSVDLLDGGAPGGGAWDVVVLQEQSQVPAWAVEDEAIRQSFLAGADGMVKRVRAKNPNARIVFYETWARAAELWVQKSKDVEKAGRDPAEMQQRTRQGYELIASNAVKAGRAGSAGPVMLARVGDLWELNFKAAKPVALHGKDGTHPAFAGSYLAGLVIFANVYDVLPEKVTYKGSLSESDAAFLRKLVMDHDELVPCAVRK